MEQMDTIEKVYLVSFTLLMVSLLFLGSARLDRL